MKRPVGIPVILGALAILIAMPAAAAEKKPITQNQTTTVKAVIEAIDHDTRLITLSVNKGETTTVYAGPEVRRFDELKVGDKVTFKYTEAAVYQIRKPGEPIPAAASDDPAIVRGTGAKPSGSITQQTTGTVTIKAIDLKASSVTVETEDGRTTSMKVKDKGKLKGLNPGDKVVITYTQALLVSVE